MSEFPTPANHNTPAHTPEGRLAYLYSSGPKVVAKIRAWDQFLKNVGLAEYLTHIEIDLSASSESKAALSAAQAKRDADEPFSSEEFTEMLNEAFQESIQNLTYRRSKSDETS